MKLHKSLYLFLLTSFFACSDDRLYYQTSDIADAIWERKTPVSFDINIDNPASSYDLLYNVRYTNEYPFYNIYMTQYLYDSTGKELSHKLKGMDIFESKTGEPIGKGFAGTYDYDIQVFSGFKFPYKGKYTIKVAQSMRDSTIAGISSIGLIIKETVPSGK